MSDSNIVIYTALPEYADVRRLINADGNIVCAASFVEVLGFQKLTELELDYFESFFAYATVLPITNRVIDRAVAIRQKKRMKLGDALIAATALVHGLELYTRNTEDFDGIPGLVCVNAIPAE